MPTRPALKKLGFASLVILANTVAVLLLIEVVFRSFLLSRLRPPELVVRPRPQVETRIESVRAIVASSPWASFRPPNYGDATLRFADHSSIIIGDYNKRDSRTPLDVFLPNQRVSMRRQTSDGKVIFDAVYSIDEYQRRVTKNSKYGKEKQNFIFSGCSLTFGSGLNDDETLASQFAKLRPNFNVYNLGLTGSGPNDILYDMSVFPDRYGHFSGSSGVFVHVAFNNHIIRSTCPLECHRDRSRWMLEKPNYGVDDQGKSHYLGTFYESRIFFNVLGSLLGKSKLLEFFNIDLPPENSSWVLDQYARTVYALKRKAEQMNLRFYFTYYPGTEPIFVEKVFAALKKYDIQVLDYSNLDMYSVLEDKGIILGDGHPNGFSNFVFANLLAQDFSL